MTRKWDLENLLETTDEDIFNDGTFEYWDNNFDDNEYLFVASDGLIDGGEPYTDEELRVINKGL